MVAIPRTRRTGAIRANATRNDKNRANPAVRAVICSVTAAPFNSCGNRSKGGVSNAGSNSGLTKAFGCIVRGGQLVRPIAVFRNDFEQAARLEHLCDLGVQGLP